MVASSRWSFVFLFVSGSENVLVWLGDAAAPASSMHVFSCVPVFEGVCDFKYPAGILKKWDKLGIKFIPPFSEKNIQLLK